MRNLSSAVISFRTHPQQVLHPEIPFRMLTSPEERAELLRKTGIDRTIFLDFTPEMSLLSAYDFLKILSNRYCIKGLSSAMTIVSGITGPRVSKSTSNMART